MKTKIMVAAALVISTFVFNACYYDHFDALYPSVKIVNACDTSLAFTYTASIQYIMAENCISCHNSSVQNGNINLDNYEGVVSQIANGKLAGSIQGASGVKVMPPTSSIKTCEIDKIKTWITNGHPQ